MQFVLALLCLASATMAADMSMNQMGDSYNFNYATGDAGGHSRSESGHGGTVAGSYSYIDANGDHRTVHYTAGPDGFHPTGDIGVDRRTAEAAEALAALAPKAPEAAPAAPAPAAPVMIPYAYYAHPWGAYHGHLGHSYVSVNPASSSYVAYW